MTVLQTDRLDKSYGAVHAVNQLSVTVTQGQVYGILGPNGSGKTTTLSMLMGIVSPDSGSFRWFDESPSPAVNRRIGALIETPNFYPYLTLEQNLRIVCQIKGVNEKDISRAISLVGLRDRARTRFATLSLGMKQRLALGSLLLGDPDVLVLDEPANALDPEGIAEVRNLIRQVAATGKTIIIASHILDEVEKVCTHVMVMKKGNKLAEGPVNNLIQGKETVILACDEPDHLDQALATIQLVEKVEREGNEFRVELKENGRMAELNRELIRLGIVLTRMESRKSRLEEQFLELVKQPENPMP